MKHANSFKRARISVSGFGRSGHWDEVPRNSAAKGRHHFANFMICDVVVPGKVLKMDVNICKL